MQSRMITGIVFLAVGLVILGAGTFLEVVNWNWASTARATTGVVIRLVESVDGTDAPVVRYRVDGQDQEWQSRSFSQPPAYALGDAVPLLYQPADPRDAIIDGFFSRHLAGLIAGGLGVTFTLLGVFLLVIAGSGARQRAWLGDHGTLVRATITIVRLEPSSDAPVWRIHAQAAGPGKSTVQVFRSEPITFDPAPFLGSRKTVDVRVDPQRPARYAMDVSWLPRRVGAGKKGLLS